MAEIEEQSPDVDELPLHSDNSATPAQQRATEIARLPGTIDDARAQYKRTLNRPMPVYLSVRAQNNSVVLQWDASYDIQGDPLVYDVRVSDRPISSTTVAACTSDDDAMPSLAGNVASFDGLGGTSTTVSLPSSGRYYFPVVVRDDDGYCQSAFGDYVENPGQDNEQFYYRHHRLRIRQREQHRYTH